MDLVTTIFADIWTHINEGVNWIVFLLVIASGYASRSISLFNDVKKITKVLVFSFVSTFIFAIYAKVDPGTYIASYFLAFGFHTVLMRWMDSKLLNVFSKSIGGGGHQQPPPKK